MLLKHLGFIMFLLLVSMYSATLEVMFFILETVDIIIALCRWAIIACYTEMLDFTVKLVVHAQND